MKWQIITTAIGIFFVSLVLSACGSSGNERHDNSQSVTSLTLLGSRSYLLKLPVNYQEDNAYKLLLAFHGSGSRANSMQSMTQLEQYSDDYIVAYPNSEAVEWNEGCDCNVARDIDDLAFVDAVIADIQKKHHVQPGEIYAAGFSQGGN